jgi:two-component system, OmpR family, response regulator ChvI
LQYNNHNSNNKREKNISSTTTKNKSSLPYRILLVDDDPDILTTFKAGLEEYGYATVDAFNDSELALSNFKTDYYDLLLLDIRMPKMNGFELYREMEKKIEVEQQQQQQQQQQDDNANVNGKKTTVKVCFITAYEVYYNTLKKDFPGLDVGCFIKKPIRIQDLITQIQSELESQ